MAPENLTVGTPYYRVTYADATRTIPGVQPMIYVGVNIFSDDDPDTAVYYFQDTVSYALMGSIASAEHETEHSDVEVQVFPHTEADVDTEVMTLPEVVAALADALKRAAWRH